MNREQIEELLKHYLDGKTTNEEEQLLRQYFATTQIVPPEWKAYKALFGWENSQRTEQREPSSMLEWPSRDGRRQSQRRSSTNVNAASAPASRKKRMAIAASIAALLFVGAGITTKLLSPSNKRVNYAVLDGRYTTDEAVIVREAEEALLLVSSSDEDTFDAIDFLDTP